MNVKNPIFDYTLPKLFKRTNTGKIQGWEIYVTGVTIVTVFGQVDGKLQTTKDEIKSGKNAGKENETSRREQAFKEAKASWMKKKKSGYVESTSLALAGKTDGVIEGGILPMLAKKFEDHIKDDFRGAVTIAAGVSVQPKLDGIRCIAIYKNGGVTLWSRTRKRITSCPHIEESIKEVCDKTEDNFLVFDGELYLHKFAKDFEKIVSAVRKDEPTKESFKIEYHIYDMVLENVHFPQRMHCAQTILKSADKSIQIVPTVVLNNLDHITLAQVDFIAAGYEGAMVRMNDMGYEKKRSKQLLKLKTFDDSEFKIVDVEEGRGKLSGHAGAFVCQTKEKKKFNVKMSGATANLVDYFKNFNNYKGKMLTVKYQGFTKDGIPRFPVGMRIRDPQL